MQRNRIICLDIGSDAIKAVLGTKSSEGIEVLEVTSVPMQGVVCGVVTDVEKCSEAVKKSLSALKAKENDAIIVGLNNYYVESVKSVQNKYIVEGAKISSADLDELYEKAKNAYLKESLDLVDVFLQYYNVDEIRGIQNPTGMQGIKLEAVYNLFSIRKNLIANIEQCVNNAGFQVEDFIFSPYYTSKILFSEEDKETGLLVIDLGADTTRASLFVDSALYTSFAIPFGSRSITLDIKNSYPVSLKQAESLKRQYSCALAEMAEENAEVSFKSSDAWGERSLRVADLAGVVQCRLDEIFRGIRYQLRKIGLEDSVESIMLIGGGSAQNSLKELLEKKFQVPVKFATLSDDAFIGSNTISEAVYANALGMLHYELEDNGETEEEDGAGFFGKLTEGFRSFFGKKGHTEDTKM